MRASRSGKYFYGLRQFFDGRIILLLLVEQQAELVMNIARRFTFQLCVIKRSAQVRLCFIEFVHRHQRIAERYANVNKSRVLFMELIEQMNGFFVSPLPRLDSGEVQFGVVNSRGDLDGSVKYLSGQLKLAHLHVDNAEVV